MVQIGRGEYRGIGETGVEEGFWKVQVGGVEGYWGDSSGRRHLGGTEG